MFFQFLFLLGLCLALAGGDDPGVCASRVPQEKQPLGPHPHGLRSTRKGALNRSFSSFSLFFFSVNLLRNLINSQLLFFYVQWLFEHVFIPVECLPGKKLPSVSLDCFLFYVPRLHLSRSTRLNWRRVFTCTDVLKTSLIPIAYSREGTLRSLFGFVFRFVLYPSFFSFQSPAQIGRIFDSYCLIDTFQCRYTPESVLSSSCFTGRELQSPAQVVKTIDSYCLL